MVDAFNVLDEFYNSRSNKLLDGTDFFLKGLFDGVDFFTILLIMVMLLKGQFTQKKSSFTHLNFVTNPYDLFSFCKIQKECYFFHTMKAFRTVKFQKGQKYIDAISVIGQCYTFLYRITQYWINIY